MDVKYTSFDRVIHLVKKLPDEKLEEAVGIIEEFSLVDFLDFCVENGCFTEAQSTTLYDFIIMWEDLDGNYYEEDPEKLNELYDAVGVTDDVFERYREE